MQVRDCPPKIGQRTSESTENSVFATARLKSINGLGLNWLQREATTLKTELREKENAALGTWIFHCGADRRSAGIYRDCGGGRGDSEDTLFRFLDFVSIQSCRPFVEA